MADLIDPWASFTLDYDKLVNQFGIGKISDILDDIENHQRLMKRGVMFGHRDFDKLVPLVNGKKDFADMIKNLQMGRLSQWALKVIPSVLIRRR